MGVCLRSPIYIFIFTIIWQKIQLVWFPDFCVHRSSFAESENFGCGAIDRIDREGWRRSCHVQKSCPLPLVAFSLPFSCPPHLHTSPKSATTRWWSTPARRNASLRRLSRATLSLSNTRYILPQLDLTCPPSTCSHLSQVLDGGDEMTSELDINFKLLSPRGHPLVAEFKKSDGTHSHHIEVSNGRW